MAPASSSRCAGTAAHEQPLHDHPALGVHRSMPHQPRRVLLSAVREQLQQVHQVRHVQCRTMRIRLRTDTASDLHSGVRAQSSHCVACTAWREHACCSVPIQHCVRRVLPGHEPCALYQCTQCVPNCYTCSEAGKCDLGRCVYGYGGTPSGACAPVRLHHAWAVVCSCQRVRCVCVEAWLTRHALCAPLNAVSKLGPQLLLR